MPAHKSEIHDHIMHQIVRGDLRPGDVIDEGVIAREFDVSKTPIREAILQLEANNIVEKKARAGARVTRLEPEELIELIELHSELEGAAAYHAARRATPMQLYELGRAEANYAGPGHAADEAKLGAYNSNLGFHLAVFDAANNATLRRELDLTGVRLVAYFRTQEGLRVDKARAVAEHGQIAAAIREGRADDARQAMRRHAEIASDTLLDVLSGMKS
ncbi:MAG: GntR family transcriptional regulator [Alphaproteobacteria bacterium]|nr:GntR family transcriptional regulator [Alphaproteobacteria bacterium]